MAEVKLHLQYPVANVARMLDRSAESVGDWCHPRNGMPAKLASVRDPIDGRPLISGETLLAVLGELLIDAAQVGSETERERTARGRKAADECRRLTAAAGRA